MGNENSHLDGKYNIEDFVKPRQVTWDQLKSMIEELNDKCQFIVDSNSNYLLFYIQKGHRNCILWKLTTRILVLKINLQTHKPIAHRILSFRQFVRIYNSIMFTVDISGNSITQDGCISAYMKDCMWRSEIGSGTTNEDGECLICFDRVPDVVLPCSHAFCEICVEKIKETDKNYCPLCREELKKDTNEDLWSIPDLPENSEIENYMLSIVDSHDKND
uniref:RING-type domain-containing protein n=1 Tax=Strongyloides papillosus TaxID=174720 RepID=A0A0N5BKH2_STREA